MTSSERIQYRLLWGVSRVAGWLPRGLLYRGFAPMVCWVLHRVVRYRVSVVRTNLANAFPEKSREELRDIERRFYRHLSEVFIDTILLGSISRREILERMVYRDVEKQEELMRGRSWISAMSHFGSWELTINYVCHTDHRVFAVYRPLLKITLAARQYAEGNFSYALKIAGEDEIGQLAATLNYMAHELGETDEYQKKFVANISHDFRSPLTSIKGYVEAILDGTIPPEMQEKYLRIVLMETERLNKLTSGLLTLNSFDTKKNRLDITDFDINAVIKDTVASFEGRCTARHISMELLFDARQQFVSADMGKIQQVMYNLLDNAIKFSPDNSVITIETTLRHEKVFISVKDQGVGIPRDSMKKIWERFYKTDSSRGKDKKGTGLGLSIVKEIIASHGEHINAISTEGVGTEFIFTLPRVHTEEE